MAKFDEDTAPPTDWWQTQSSGQDWQQTQDQPGAGQQQQPPPNNQQQSGDPAEILAKLKQLMGNDWSTENIRKNIDALKALGIEVQNQERGDFRPRFRLPNGDVWDFGPGGWQSRGQMDPGFREHGSSGTSGQGAPGMPGSGSSMSDFFHNMPGYQFGLEEGLKGIERSQFARGTGLTGGALKELARYAGGYADQAYGDWVDRFMRASKMGQDAADQGSS